MNHDGAALESALLIEEYRAVQTEAASLAGTARRIVAAALLAGILLAAAAPLIVQAKASIVFLGAPLLFAGLSWLQLNCLAQAARIADYLRSELAPRARRALAEAGSEAGGAPGLLGFEDGRRSLMRGSGRPLAKLLFAPIALAPVAAPWVMAVLSAIAYFAIRSQLSLAFTKLHAALAVADVIVLVYTAAWILRVEARR